VAPPTRTTKLGDRIARDLQLTQTGQQALANPLQRITNENEITRIAVNWILLDYQKHGPRSVLTQLLASLHG